jgi:hypothetical protein
MFQLLASCSVVGVASATHSENGAFASNDGKGFAAPVPANASSNGPMAARQAQFQPRRRVAALMKAVDELAVHRQSPRTACGHRHSDPRQAARARFNQSVFIPALPFKTRVTRIREPWGPAGTLLRVFERTRRRKFARRHAVHLLLRVGNPTARRS